MPPNLDELSDQVWTQTLPALRRRRRGRRLATSGAAAAAFAAIVTAWMLAPRPSSSPAAGVAPPSPVAAEGNPASLAVLVVDQSGARFEQLRPDQIDDENLRFQLTLDLVMRRPADDIY